jgi:hypothetical protein
MLTDEMTDARAKVQSLFNELNAERIIRSYLPADQQYRLDRFDWWSLIDQLDAVQILRKHAPAAQQYLVDRLESTLRLIERIEDEGVDENDDLWDEL